MAIPGERFEIDLDGDGSGDSSTSPMAPMGFVKDILERPVSASVAAPSLSTAPTPAGFPAHKKRVRLSAFKQRADAAVKGPPQNNPVSKKTNYQESTDWWQREKEEITQENERRINAMSAEEIEREQQELLATLSPKLIERLMKGSLNDNLAASASEGSKSKNETSKQPTVGDEIIQIECPTDRKIPVENDENDDPELCFEDRAPKTLPVGDLLPSHVKVHFPAPPKLPELDPSSPEFLEQLHSKYFPDFPTDPSKLSWMAPISDTEDKTYHPDEPVTASTIRFDFKGNILPPRTARELPVHLGLHHHADAPGAAGYTVAELSHLARSTFPAQRCMAMQTLGRILYRLGVGAYENEDITQGLWRCIKEGRAIETLEAAATGKGIAHMSVKAYAAEALWNWQLGGGQRWKAE